MTHTKPDVDGSSAYRTEAEHMLADAGIVAITLGQTRYQGRIHLAILVGDEDIEAARRIARKKGGDKVHFLSSGGRKGGSYRLQDPRYRAITMAVMPVCTSETLLARAKLEGGADPKLRQQLALYVKAYFGSIARLLELPEDACEGVETGGGGSSAGDLPPLDSDRARLDGYLASIGWQPPADMLERLGLTDPWIADDLLPTLGHHRQAVPGLAAFFCREHALELGFLDRISAAIEEKGFQILASCPVEGEIALRLRDSTRGGNWGAGPFAVNGGPPKHMIFALDVFPVAPDQSLLGQHPFLDNANTLSAKLHARDRVFAEIPAAEHFNPLHSSDNSGEALGLAEMLLPEQAFEDLSQCFTATMGRMESLIGDGVPVWRDAPVAATFRLSGQGAARVRKVFRPQYAGLADTVAKVHEALSPDWPEVPKVLSRQEGCIDLEARSGACEPVAMNGRLLSLRALLRLRKVLHAADQAGFTLVDWSPERNLCVSVDEGEALTLGFDHVQIASAQLPAGPDGATPRRAVAESADNAGWSQQIGVSKAVLLEASPASVAAYRMFMAPAQKAKTHVTDLLQKQRLKARSFARRLRNRISG